MTATFDVFQAGKWADLHQHVFQARPDLKAPGKLFLREKVGLNGAEVSLNRMSAGAAMPFFHRHKQNEELYIFVGGSGEMVIDDQTFPVTEGTVVRVSPKGARYWRNNSSNDLYFICMQYRESQEEVRDIIDGEPVQRPLPA